MERLTKKISNSYYVDEIKKDHNGYYGEAITKLAQLENMVETLEKRQLELSKELEQLRLESKKKSYQFREAMSEKLLNTRTLTFIDRYELR